MKYKIYQLDGHDPKNHGKIFMPWRVIEKDFNFNDYKKVYSGNLDTKSDNMLEILDIIFEMFNLRHPDDFHGHSLSVSDVVMINGDMYFCDSCSWIKI